MYPTDLTDEQWAALKPHVVKPTPTVQGKGRPPKQDYRAEINGMLYVHKTGCQWRMLPSDFPPWKSVYGYLRRWRQDGTWDLVLSALREVSRQNAESNAKSSVASTDARSKRSTSNNGVVTAKRSEKSALLNEKARQSA